MTLSERIANGEFESKLEWPAHPKKPKVWERDAFNLTEKQFKEMQSLKVKYEEELEKYNEMVSKRNLDRHCLYEKFQKALCEEFGVDYNSKFVQIMLKLAWDYGHAGGLGDVLNYFDDLMELHNEYVRSRSEG